MAEFGSLAESIELAWRRSILIAVCGIDGSGKSSVIERLNQRMLAEGWSVKVTQQPTELYRQVFKRG
jgi:thymidylate kinase